MIIGFIPLFIFLAYVFILAYQKRKEAIPELDIHQYDVKDLLNIVLERTSEIYADEKIHATSEYDYQLQLSRRVQAMNNLDICVDGIPAARAFVKDLVRNILKDEAKLRTEADIMKYINFRDNNIDPYYMWEAILYVYIKQHGAKALVMLFDDYKLDAKDTDLFGQAGMKGRAIEAHEIVELFGEMREFLVYEDYLDIMVNIIYTKYKGFPFIDTMMPLDIDGFTIGTSGAEINKELISQTASSKTNSIWLHLRGVYVHLKFLDVKDTESLKRLVTQISRYDATNQLTRNEPRRMGSMFDGTRVTATLSPLSSAPAAFIRKHIVSRSAIPTLLTQPYIKGGVDVLIQLIIYIMKGCVTTAITGQQGSGKTTILRGTFEYIDPDYNIRVLETMPELKLNEAYPDRNIFEISETQSVDLIEGQDLLKKSDGAVSVIGEVATDGLASVMLQLAGVASIFTLFTHHAVTSRDLVMFLAASLMSAQGLAQREAIERVLEHITLDMHVVKIADPEDPDKSIRFVERVTLIEKYDTKVDFSSDVNVAAIQYYDSQVNTASFGTYDILYFDMDSMSYKTGKLPNRKFIDRILTNLTAGEGQEFLTFLDRNWG